MSARIVRCAEPLDMCVRGGRQGPDEPVSDGCKWRRRKLECGDREDREPTPDREVLHALQLYPLAGAAFHQPRRGG